MTQQNIGELFVPIKLDLADFGHQIDSMKGKLEGVTKGITESTKKMSDDVAKNLKKVGGDFTAVGKAMSVGVTAPIVALGGFAIKAASDFESSFAGVRKTVDATEAQFTALSGSLREMALRIPVNVNELNRIAEAAGALGVKRQDILGFTEVIAKLGVATDLSTDEAANGLARFSNIMGTTGDKVDELGSTLVALGNAGASTESEILAMSLRFAGAGKTIGLTEDEVLSFANALSGVGLQAELGGSAFQRVMIKMAQAARGNVGSVDDIFKKLGITQEQYFAAVKQGSKAAEASIAQFAKQVGLSADQMVAMVKDATDAEDAFKELEFATGKSREQIIKLVANSKSGDQALKDLAQAAGMSVGQLTGLVNRSQSAFRNVDKLAQVTGLSADEILRMGQAGATGNEQLEKWGETLGISGDQLKDLVEDTDAGGEKLKTFARVAGMSAADFAKAFKERPAEAIMAFISGLGRMQAAGEDIFGVLKTLKMDQIGITQAMLAAGGASDKFAASLTTGKKAWKENNALNKEAAERFKTFESQMQLAKAQVQDMAIQLGVALLPVILEVLQAMKPFIARVSELIKKFSELSPRTQKIILAIVGLAAAIGPLLIVLGMMASGLGAIITIAPLFAGAFTLMLGPIGLVIAILGALVVAGVLVWKNWDEIKVKGTQIWGAIKSFMVSTMTAIRNFIGISWDFVASKTVGVWNGLREFLSRNMDLMVGKVTVAFRVIREFIGRSWDFVAAKTVAVVNRIQGAVNTIMGLVRNVTGAINAVSNIRIPTPSLPSIPNPFSGSSTPSDSRVYKDTGGKTRVNLGLGVPKMDTGGLVRGPGMFSVGAGVKEIVRSPGSSELQVTFRGGGQGEEAIFRSLVQNVRLRTGMRA